MDLTTWLNITLGIVATVATVIATYFAWHDRHQAVTEDTIAIGEKVSIYLTRRSTVDAFAGMIDRSPDRALIFGQCRACTDYPVTFYHAVLRASARGVRFNFLVNSGPEGREFAERLVGISTMEIRFKEIEYARILGVQGSESIAVVPSPEGYIGLHLRDPLAAKQAYIMFDLEWAAGSKL